MSHDTTKSDSLNELFERAHRAHLALIEDMIDVPPIVFPQDALDDWEDTETLRWRTKGDEDPVSQGDLDELVALGPSPYREPQTLPHRQPWARAWWAGFSFLLFAGGALAAGLAVQQATATPRRTVNSFSGPLAGSASTGFGGELLPRPATAAALETSVVAAAEAEAWALPTPQEAAANPRPPAPRAASGAVTREVEDEASTEAAPAMNAETRPVAPPTALPLPPASPRDTASPPTAIVAAAPTASPAEAGADQGVTVENWTAGLFEAPPLVAPQTSLSRAQVVERLRPVTNRVRNCTPEHVEDVVVQLQVQGATGRVTHTSVTGELANTASSRCIERALSGVQFPLFSQSQQQVRDYVFALR